MSSGFLTYGRIIHVGPGANDLHLPPLSFVPQIKVLYF